MNLHLVQVLVRASAQSDPHARADGPARPECCCSAGRLCDTGEHLCARLHGGPRALRRPHAATAGRCCRGGACGWHRAQSPDPPGLPRLLSRHSARLQTIPVRRHHFGGEINYSHYLSEFHLRITLIKGYTLVKIGPFCSEYSADFLNILLANTKIYHSKNEFSSDHVFNSQF